MQRSVDSQIIKALKDGDSSTFDSVFLAYYRRVFVFIRKIINSDEDAQEISQEVFIKLWQKRESFSYSDKVGSLLFTIAKNMAIDYLRKKKVLQDYVDNEKHIARNSYADDSPEIDAQYIQFCIDIVVSRLSLKQQQIFQLMHQEGLNNQEVAQRLNLSKKTIDNNMTLIREKFREIIELGIDVI